MDSGLAGLAETRDTNAFRNSLICQTRLQIICCSRLEKADGRPRVTVHFSGELGKLRETLIFYHEKRTHPSSSVLI